MRAAACVAVLVVLSLASSCGRPKGAAEAPERVMNFDQLFSEHCSGCHGVSGMQGPGPRLHDPLYLAIVSKEDLRDVITHGRPGTAMPAFGGGTASELTDKQIDVLVDGMKQRWARPLHLQGVALPTYSVAKAPPGDPKRGQMAYMRNCMMCHGFGKFKGAAGSIIDPHYLALASDQMLRTTVIVGRTDWGMPDWRHRIPGHVMSDQDISDVVAWLSAQRPKGLMTYGQTGGGDTAQAGSRQGSAEERRP